MLPADVERFGQVREGDRGRPGELRSVVGEAGHSGPWWPSQIAQKWRMGPGVTVISVQSLKEFKGVQLHRIMFCMI